MKLTERFEDSFYLNNTKIQLHLPFDTVLRSFELLQDDEFQDYEKLEILLEMFVISDIGHLTIEEKVKVWETILTKFINEDEESQTNENEIKVFDIDQDSEYIYASFLSDYRIDLFEQQGKLHWKKFQALLKGLNEDSKLNQVIGYRTMEIPKMDEHNGKERARIIKLKEAYALKLTETEQKKETEIKVKALDDKLSAVANAFKKGGKR